MEGDFCCRGNPGAVRLFIAKLPVNELNLAFSASIESEHPLKPTSYNA